MRLAFVIQELHPTAGQTHDISEIIKYLSSIHEDWSIDVLTPKITYPLTEGMQKKNVRVVKIDQLYSAILFNHKLSRKFSEYNLIYVKGSYPYVFPAVRSGRPNVLVIHQRDSPRLFGSLQKKLRIIGANFLTGLVIKRPTVLVTISDELSLYYSKRYGVKVNVIEDQISDSFYVCSRRDTSSVPHKIGLLTVGYWDGYNGRKRQDSLLKYFAEALQSHPDMSITLVGLSNENKKELGELCLRLGISEKVTLKGYLNENELVREFLNNYIYATATTYEGFYRQIVEAFATGMPAVVFDASRVVDDFSQRAAVNHVLRSKGGLLYNDSKTFIESIEMLSKQYALFSENAAKYAQNYTRSVQGEKTDTLICYLNSKGKLLEG